MTDADPAPPPALPDPHRENLIRTRHHRPPPNGTSLPDRYGATAAGKQPGPSTPKPETETPSVPPNPHRKTLIRADIADAARQPPAAPQPKPRQRRRDRADGENQAESATETPPTPAHAARNNAPDAPR